MMYDEKALQLSNIRKRITRQELMDRFDVILDEIEKDKVAYVVEDPAGKNDILMCPAQWFSYCFDENFGCIVTSAIRYAIERHTYMPGIVRDFVRKYKSVLDEKTIAVAIWDIDEKLELDFTEDAMEWRELRNELQLRLEEMEQTVIP